jgi:glyoxylase-like metal-dependent hydrolase (beta-lactamase superfamily II)
VDPLERERPLRVDVLTVGPLETMCYVVSDKETDEVMVIDPGGAPEEIIESVRMSGGELRYIVDTHGHADHMAANAALKEAYPAAQVCVHEADAEMLTKPVKNLSMFLGCSVKSPPADRLLKEGDELVLGQSRFRVIHLPGHTPGGVALYWGGTGTVAGMIFCGDTLFADGCGRTDFPGGSEEDLRRSVREKVLTLPDDTVVLPGHGPATTVGREKQTNTFFADG